MKKNIVLVVDDNKTLSSFLYKKIKAYTKNIEIKLASSLQKAQEIVLEFHENIFVATVGLNLIDAPNGEAVEYFNSQRINTIVFTGNYNEEIQKKLEQFDYVSNYFFKDSSL